MDIQKTRKVIRYILGRMQAAQASEILLCPRRKPQIKIAGEWQDWDMPAMPPEQLDELTRAVIQPEQWQDLPAGPPRKHCQCHLFALGIGRFKVVAVAYESVLSLSITDAKPKYRPQSPTDTSYVPFVPGKVPPSLSAEADMDV